MFEDTSLSIREVADYVTRTSVAAASSAVALPYEFQAGSNVADLGVLRL